MLLTGVVGPLCPATGFGVIAVAAFAAERELGTGAIGDDKGETDPMACGRLSW